MTVIVNDTGFAADDWQPGFAPLAEAAANSPGLDLPSDSVALDVQDWIATAQAIRIDFPSFADGRGFTIARQLRLMGFKGRLRARGHVLADQFAMARRCGFDEVEISDEMAARQPEDQWLARANWRDHSYQARLRG